MVPSLSIVSTRKALEDPLAYMPRSTVAKYSRGHVIFNQGDSATGICLLISGKVKVSRTARDGRQLMLEIYRPDDFFGEAAILGGAPCAEKATALEDTMLMTWTKPEIEDLIAKRPLLGVAFLQMMTKRSMELTNRIESLSSDTIANRLARSLIHFADRLGALEDDGSTRMGPFTHQLLSEYVGTSREIVTHFMCDFRKRGYVKYSRKGIVLYCDALHNSLRQSA